MKTIYGNFLIVVFLIFSVHFCFLSQEAFANEEDVQPERELSILPPRPSSVSIGRNTIIDESEQLSDHARPPNNVLGYIYDTTPGNESLALTITRRILGLGPWGLFPGLISVGYGTMFNRVMSKFLFHDPFASRNFPLQLATFSEIVLLVTVPHMGATSEHLTSLVPKSKYNLKMQRWKHPLPWIEVVGTAVAHSAAAFTALIEPIILVKTNEGVNPVIIFFAGNMWLTNWAEGRASASDVVRAWSLGLSKWDYSGLLKKLFFIDRSEVMRNRFGATLEELHRRKQLRKKVHKRLVRRMLELRRVSPELLEIIWKKSKGSCTHGRDAMEKIDKGYETLLRLGLEMREENYPSMAEEADEEKEGSVHSTESDSGGELDEEDKGEGSSEEDVNIESFDQILFEHQQSMTDDEYLEDISKATGYARAGIVGSLNLWAFPITWFVAYYVFHEVFDPLFALIGGSEGGDNDSELFALNFANAVSAFLATGTSTFSTIIRSNAGAREIERYEEYLNEGRNGHAKTAKQKAEARILRVVIDILSSGQGRFMALPVFVKGLQGLGFETVYDLGVNWQSFGAIGMSLPLIYTAGSGHASRLQRGAKIALDAILSGAHMASKHCSCGYCEARAKAHRDAMISQIEGLLYSMRFLSDEAVFEVAKALGLLDAEEDEDREDFSGIVEVEEDGSDASEEDEDPDKVPSDDEDKINTPLLTTSEGSGGAKKPKVGDKERDRKKAAALVDEDDQK
ncbi:MAG: hypothetical protein HON43_02890 [Alphaproteobacteria bacterium]|nr:hypothetical protein [Alphaproteobacteria bacterium]